MKRLRRWLFNFAVLLSLVLCIAFAALWVRSELFSDEYQWNTIDDSTGITFLHHDVLTIGRGRISLFNTRHWAAPSLIRPAPSGTGIVYSELGRYTQDFPSSFHQRLAPEYPRIAKGYFVREPVLGFFYAHWAAAGRPARSEVRQVIVPIWFPILISSFLPGLAVRRIYAWRRECARSKVGNCRVCGYDLRATPERCPECGAIPAAKEEAMP